MVCTSGSPTLKTKAADAYGILLFLIYLLPGYRDHLQLFDQLHEGGRLLADMVRMMQGPVCKWIADSSRTYLACGNDSCV